MSGTSRDTCTWSTVRCDRMASERSHVQVAINLAEAYETVSELSDRAKRCSLSDTGQWTNQNVVFTKSLTDMFPLAKTILKGARQRDECRGAHYKPAFQLPGVEASDPVAMRITSAAPAPSRST